MKKMRKVTAVLLGLLAIASMLIGCGGKDMSASKFCGTWKATTAVYSEVPLNVEDVFGGEFALVLGEDGKCTVTLVDKTEEGKWDEVEGAVVIDGDDKLTYTDNGGVLVLEYNGLTVNFERAAAAEQ